jgi:hypothetical protein
MPGLASLHFVLACEKASKEAFQLPPDIFLEDGTIVLIGAAGAQHVEPSIRPRQPPGVEPPDAFSLLGAIMSFQKDSQINQRENAVHLLSSRLAREASPRTPASITPDLVRASLKRLRSELLRNYVKWSKFIWVRQVRLMKHFPADPTVALALEIALYLLIWGEASNLRFCPEFLCWSYHRGAQVMVDTFSKGKATKVLDSWLHDIISPVYHLVAKQSQLAKGAGLEETLALNYDDFNEIWWTRSCLKLGLVPLDTERINRMYVKTFVERRSWLVPLTAFWRVVTLLLVALNVLVLIAYCDEKQSCSNALRWSFVFTLAGCYALIEVYAFLFLLPRRIVRGHFFHVLGSGVRFAAKLGILYLLYREYPDGAGLLETVGFSFAEWAQVYLAAVGLVELLKFSLIHTRRSPRLPWFVLFNVILGQEHATEYARVDKRPDLADVILYSAFWLLTLAIKLLVNFYTMVRPLVRSSISVYNATDLVIPDTGIPQYHDPHNIGVIAVTWLTVGFIYFVDVQIWYIILQAVFSACTGVLQHVGEKRLASDVCQSFEGGSLHSRFFTYLNESDALKQMRFAYVWNEIVASMRTEDILSDAQAASMRYFTIQLTRPNEALSLLPSFLLSGKIQSSVSAVQRFSSQNSDNIKALAGLGEKKASEATGIHDYASVHEGGIGVASAGRKRGAPSRNSFSGDTRAQAVTQTLRKEQLSFLQSHEAAADSEQAVALQHFFLSLFFLLEQLTRESKIGESLWFLYSYIVQQEKQQHKSRRRQSMLLKIFQDSRGRCLLLLHHFPALIQSTSELLLTILRQDHAAVKPALDAVCAALAAFVDPALGCPPETSHAPFCGALSSLREALLEWPKCGRGVGTGGMAGLLNEHLEFLSRFQSLISSTSSPGQIVSKEAMRRVSFFINSLFMDMPKPTPVESMPAFSIMTPYYSEDVILNSDALTAETNEGVTVLEYLMSIFPSEWINLIQRLQHKFPHVNVASTLSQVNSQKDMADLENELRFEVQLWASYRSQTLARTARGMMYHEQSIRLLSVVEASDFSYELMSNIVMKEDPSEDPESGRDVYVRVLSGKLKYGKESEALAARKFTYIISCQIHAKMLRSSNAAEREKATQVEILLRSYPALRVAYVDSIEGRHYSCLIGYDVERRCILKHYQVELPGPILVGEGKPNNQNHAIIFTRGEALQAIDMNQDATLEDCLKIRSLLGEFGFGKKRGGNIARIVGFREFVFTHKVSSVANFFSLQELGFVTSTQRFLDSPLSIRFHYGHPDFFDKISAISLGGISAASKSINLSEDIFGGFNMVLRGGKATQCEYIQVGKGRDVGLGQLADFTAKISMGNGMQARSRQVTRMAQQLDIFRLLSFYYSSVGFFINQVVLVFSIFLFIYGKLLLVVDSRREALGNLNEDVASVISTEYVFQLGFLLLVPIILLLAAEEGMGRSITKFTQNLLRGSFFFYIFMTAVNAYYVQKVFLLGTAGYKATGRGFVIQHESFLTVYTRYLQSHFAPAAEIFLLLIAYAHFGLGAGIQYGLETFAIWLLVAGWLWSPFLFTPNGFDWSQNVGDAHQWLRFMTAVDDDPSKSWKAWWSQSSAEVKMLGLQHKLTLFIWRCRFLIVVYACLCGIARDRTERGDRWKDQYFYWVLAGVVVIALVTLLIKPASREFLGSGSQRFFGLLLGIGSLFVVIFLPLFGLVSFIQIVYVFVAVAVLLYYFALIAELFGKFQSNGYYYGQGTIRGVWVIHAAHMLVGLLVHTPILLVSFLPFASPFQTRLLFNQDWARRYEVAQIFAQEKARSGATSRGGGLLNEAKSMTGWTPVKANLLGLPSSSRPGSQSSKSK